jgi:hypothetical protein
MSRFNAVSGFRVAPEVGTAVRVGARIWLAIGILLLAMLPEARGHHPWVGWLPFWCLLAPLLLLAQVDALSGFPATARWWSRARRRFSRRPVQARRVRRKQRNADALPLSR